MMKAFTLTLTLQASSAAHVEMKTEGWIFLAAAWIFILTLTFYTFGKILKK